jgi:hypothetical protein
LIILCGSRLQRLGISCMSDIAACPVAPYACGTPQSLVAQGALPSAPLWAYARHGAARLARQYQWYRNEVLGSTLRIRAGFALKSWRKTCAKAASKQWFDGGMFVHNSHTIVVKPVQAKDISPKFLVAFARSRTQIVHSPTTQNNRSNKNFSAVSTPPITTTTT